MDYVIFDLEWNGCFSKKLNTHLNEIIEFGAVKLNEKLEITGKFNCLVRPALSTRLSSSVKELTSLTFEEVKRGVPFDYGYSKFKKFADGCILMTWSTTDIETLVANLQFHKKIRTIPFLKRYADLQIYCHDMLGLSGTNALGLQAAADLLHIDTEDIPHHRALGDSMITALCFKKLYHKAAVESYIQNAGDNGFYERIFFHTCTIEDENSEWIDLSSVFFNCPDCGARCIPQGPLRAKLKGFSTEYTCEHCGSFFTGRVQYKRKYDSTLMTKKIIRHKVPETEI